MASHFDPYHKWLGIPPKEQPPTLYRLLQIEQFESDEDVIENAAQRQITFLKNAASGPYSRESQQLLNEINKARVTLLNKENRASYDESLRNSLRAVQEKPLSGPLVSPAQQVPEVFPTSNLDAKLVASPLPVAKAEVVASSVSQNPTPKVRVPKTRKARSARRSFSVTGLVLVFGVAMLATAGGFAWMIGNVMERNANRENKESTASNSPETKVADSTKQQKKETTEKKPRLLPPKIDPPVKETLEPTSEETNPAVKPVAHQTETELLGWQELHDLYKASSLHNVDKTDPASVACAAIFYSFSAGRFRKLAEQGAVSPDEVRPEDHIQVVFQKEQKEKPDRTNSEQKALENYIEKLSDRDALHPTVRLSMLRGIAIQARKKPPFTPTQAKVVADYLLAAKDDEEFAKTLDSMTELKESRIVRLAIGAGLVNAGLSSQQLTELVQAITDEQLPPIEKDQRSLHAALLREREVKDPVREKVAMLLAETYQTRCRDLGIEESLWSSVESPHLLMKLLVEHSKSQFTSPTPEELKVLQRDLRDYPDSLAARESLLATVEMHRMYLPVVALLIARKNPYQAKPAKQLVIDFATRDQAYRSYFHQLCDAEETLCQLWQLLSPTGISLEP